MNAVILASEVGIMTYGTVPVGKGVKTNNATTAPQKRTKMTLPLLQT